LVTNQNCGNCGGESHDEMIGGLAGMASYISRATARRTSQAKW